MTDQQLCEHFVATVDRGITDIKDRLTELSMDESTHIDCTALFMEYNEYLSENNTHEMLCINSETGEVNYYTIEPDND